MDGHFTNQNAMGLRAGFGHFLLQALFSCFLKRPLAYLCYLAFPPSCLRAIPFCCPDLSFSCLRVPYSLQAVSIPVYNIRVESEGLFVRLFVPLIF